MLRPNIILECCLYPVRLHLILAVLPAISADPPYMCRITAVIAYHTSAIPASLTLWNRFSAPIKLAMPLLCSANLPMLMVVPQGCRHPVRMAHATLRWSLCRVPRLSDVGSPMTTA